MTRTPRTLIVAVAVGLTLTACGGDEPGDPATQQPTSGATATPAPLPTNTATDVDLPAEGTVSGTLTFDGVAHDLVEPGGGLFWCDYYEGDTVVVAADAAGGIPAVQFTGDQLKIETAETIYLTLPADGQIETVPEGGITAATDTGGTLTIEAFGQGQLTFGYSGPVTVWSGNTADVPETVDVDVAIECNR